MMKDVTENENKLYNFFYYRSFIKHVLNVAQNYLFTVLDFSFFTVPSIVICEQKTTSYKCQNNK